ncbi:sensor histidine kinase [Pseudobutyrivibrio sp. MD2005]|uniref:sensor histidine kinase n=1 Tax=Pseudobutyrivibrio sp. MD2005 TaxID=1410616 RepID=UPI000483A59B|nr:HAMP domain-containing sensor histidine kinase [Pseudobutyrivibrio sp. MD2005]
MKTNLQRLLLAIMYTMFIVGMISFYQEQLWIMFISFVGFAVSSVQYAKACKEESEEELDEKKERLQYITDRYDDIKERNDRMKKEFENQVELKERTIESANNEIDGLNNRLEAALKFDEIKGILPESAIFADELDLISVATPLRQVLREYHERMKEANILIQISEPNDEVYARAEEKCLRILFKNIIDNAVKFTGENGKIVITISKALEEVIIVIRDTGEGVPESDLDLIFDMNYQGENNKGGAGLGLAQAKAIVEFFGGRIYARSTIEEGMGIFIHLQAE